ncbi:tetratricopeptide repeat-containing sulfotransferase family protein [Limnospira platensis CENA597]|uniref:tetratricopeptide repeat-containing sulfotransferase family protein n=2 Tax=Limnospira platensis TaxID=118562 RepID=UPI003DA0E685
MSGGGCVGQLVMRSGEGMSAGELLRQANQLKRSGRLDEAIALYHQVIDINPHFAWAYHSLGDALVKQEYFDDALNYFHKAVEINPHIASFYYHLSEVLAIQGKFNRAIIYFDKFLKINFKNQPNFSNNGCIEKFLNNQITESSFWSALKYAHLLSHQNHIEPAINVYQKIIQDSPYQYSEVYNKLGELLLKTEDTKKAVSVFETAIFLEPQTARYYINFAEATNLWNPCVRAYRKAIKLNPVEFYDYYNQLEINHTHNIKVKNPIFVVGCGHSGTSVMLALLGSHPCFYPIPYESEIFLKNISKIKEQMRIWDDECLADGKLRWIEKTPPHIFQIGKFMKIRPQSQFIIMLRDGRDVVCSLKHRPDYQRFFERIDRWIYDNLAGLLYWEHPRVRVVKYEDLVSNPEDTLIKICNFLGEKYNDKMLEFHKTEKHWYSEEIVKPEIIDTMTKHKQNRNWQINQALFDGRGRWQQEMTPGEKIIFKKKAQQYLLEWGYVQDDNW